LDGHDRSKGTKDPSGASDTQLDAAGRVKSSIAGSKGSSGSLENRYRWTEFEYDQAGRVTKEIRKLFETPEPEPSAVDVVTERVYDDAGRVTDVIDPLGRVTHTDYDEAGRVWKVRDPAGNETTTEYDEAGNRWKTTVSERRPDGTRDIFETTFLYDDQNRLETVTAPGNRVTRYGYDRRGLKTSEIAPDTGETRWEYDLAGRKTKETDPLGHVTSWEYDLLGNLVRLEDANHHVTTYAYDAQSRLEAETRGEPVRAPGLTWLYTYDDDGNRLTAEDPNGTVTTYTYDDAGRLTGRTLAKAAGVLGPSAEALTLDPLGRVTHAEATGASESVVRDWSYDSLDRTRSESVKVGAGPQRTVGQEWDLAGNRSAILYPSGRTYALTPDPLDRIARIEQPRSGGLSPLPVVDYGDDGSRQSRRTLGNGLVETRTYSAEPWLTGIDVRRTGAAIPLLGLEYRSRNPKGYKLDVVRADRSTKDTYGYDLAGRITSEELGFPEPPPAPPAVVNPDVKNVYTIDPVLNVTERVRTQAGTTVPTTGDYNARNQVTRWGTDGPTYDPNGNMKTAAGVTLAYDAHDRMVKGEFQNGDGWEGLRDTDGRLVREKTTVGAAAFEADIVQLGDQVIERYPKDGTTPTQVFVHGRGIDEVVKAELDPTASGTTTSVYPVQDELGNVTHLTDQSGAVLEAYSYEGYGKLRIFDPNNSPLSASAYGWNRLFQGRERFSMFEAYDFRNRVLWAEMGRFGQEDPAGTVDSPNRYQALRGAWTAWTDPSGQVDLKLIDPWAAPASTLKQTIFDRRLYSLFDRVKSPPGEFTIGAHGYRFGELSSFHRQITVQDLKKEMIANGWKPGMNVWLIACHVGQDRALLRNELLKDPKYKGLVPQVRDIAYPQRLADELGVTVFAPDGEVSPHEDGTVSGDPGANVNPRVPFSPTRKGKPE
jgi:RHS repeat-associated protein